MIVLIILLALIVLVFFVPYGVDAAYENGQARLSVRAGPVSIRLYPKKPKTAKQLEREIREFLGIKKVSKRAYPVNAVSANATNIPYPFFFQKSFFMVFPLKTMP